MPARKTNVYDLLVKRNKGMPEKKYLYGFGLCNIQSAGFS